MQLFGWAVVVVLTLAAAGARLLAPHDVGVSFPALLDAPPTAVHLRDEAGAWHAPFIYRWKLVNQLEQRYEQDRETRVGLRWFDDGHLVTSADDAHAPLLLLGADSYGRDVFSRLLFGARVSLGLALLASTGAIFIGLIVGGLAGYLGGPTDDVLMRLSDFVLVLPVMYVALALRAALPLVLLPRTVFLMLTAIFAILGAPFVARGVRAIIRSERQAEYAIAALSLGAGHARLLARHLVPATAGFVGVQLTILVPAFIVAEATLSYIGLGFPEPIASWGAMLQEGSNVRALADFPWLLSPGAAIFLAVLGLNLLLQRAGADPLNLHYNSTDESRRRARPNSNPVR